MRRFVPACLILAGLAPALPSLDAAAQGMQPRAGGTSRPEAARPEPPKPPAPPPQTLDDLFTRLSAAKDEREAQGVARLIERRWSRSGSDTADLLMQRAADAAKDKNHPLAIELLDRVLALEPGWAEAWYRRANVFFLAEDPASAMADLRQVIAREPRHFGAWAGLGHILMSLDDKKRALEAYRRALAVHPHLERVKDLAERLAPELDGRDI